MKKVIVNAVPKSGTNLLAKCLILLGYKQKGVLGGHTVLANILSAMSKRSGSRGYTMGLGIPTEVSRLAINWKLNNIKNGQFTVSHVGYTEELLHEILNFGFAPIQIIRDPRAVLASWVPYVLKHKGVKVHDLLISLNHEERYVFGLHGGENNGILLQSLHSRCQAVDPWISHPKVLVVKFEDLVGEQGGGEFDRQQEVLLSICKHLQLPEESVEYVQEHLFGDKRRTFRAGQIGSWKVEVPESVQNQFEQSIGGILRDWGYE